jgi:Short C-terminal domain
MQALTPNGEQAVQNIAQRYGVSIDAVKTLLVAVSAGGGTMAQFYHPELGGGGQWMRGGMTMVGDMFNHGLKNLVDNLCCELSSLLSSQQVFAPVPAHNQQQSNGFGFGGNNWWPSELGSPSSSGGQNDARYAYFPSTRRLAISRNGQLTIYDTLDHQIGGVQQQQGGYSGSLSFSSQYGTFTVDSLPLANTGAQAAPAQPVYEPAPSYEPAPAAPQQGGSQRSQSHDEILSALERLGALHKNGVLSDAEFQSKKAELLSRL